jgi:putative transposase
MEYDSGVVEFYDQPAPAFKFSYQTRSGHQAAPFHTPDFFVLRTDQAGWEEWKPEEQLAVDTIRARETWEAVV